MPDPGQRYAEPALARLFWASPLLHYSFRTCPGCELTRSGGYEVILLMEVIPLMQRKM